MISLEKEKKNRDEEIKECEACEALGDYMCAGMGRQGRGADKDGK